jgi:uncharacterized protein (DUF1810 family)
MPNLERFTDAQADRDSYETAKSEITGGRKTGHWIWYIFPQLQGIGNSSNAQIYGIADFNEACEYLINPILFQRYHEMLVLVKGHLVKKPPVDLDELMGARVDVQKLVSSLTLFRAAAAFLESEQENPEQNFKDLKNLCDAILTIIRNITTTEGKYFNLFCPCQFTQPFLPPDMVPQIIEPKESPGTTVSNQNVFFKPLEANKPDTSTIEPGKTDPVRVEPLQTDSGKIDPLRVEPLPTAPKKTDPIKPQTSSPLIPHLKDYIEQRQNEWSFHYNFFGIVALTYFILDTILGTDHFNIKKSEVKISGATKLMQRLDPTFTGHIKSFTTAEKAALKEGRLGTLVDTYGGLEQLIKKAPLTPLEETDQEEIHFNTTPRN